MAMEQQKLSLQDYLDKREPVNQKGFVVDNDEKANWVLRKLRAIEAKKAENKKLAESEINKVKEWLDTVNSQLDHDKEYFEGLLIPYSIKLREEDNRFKSRKLPNGRFGFRKQSDKWEYNNEAVIASLEAAGRDELVRVKKEPKKTDIKKHYEAVNGQAVDPETGEVLEGITIKQGDETFYVKVVE